jgi:hypothetical protein
MTKDLNRDVAVASTLAPALRTTTASGATVDLQGYGKAAFVAHIGVVTDGTHAFDPEESDDGSTWANIASTDLSGTFVSATSSADETVQEVGYLGTKRYVRCNVTVTGSPSTGGLIAVSVVRSGARTLPV